MKKVLIWFGAVVILLAVAVALLPVLLDVNRYHDRIQSELQKQLGRQVQLGQMNLSLLPPAFKVQNAVIAEDPKFNSETPFAQVAELYIELKLLPLLHRDVQVASLRMVHPKVELICGTDGAWNFSTIGNTQPAATQPVGGQTKPLQLDRLQIDDGSVAITDLQKHQPRMVYQNIDVLLRDFAPGKPFAITVSAHLPGGGKQIVKLDGHGGPIEDATLDSTPFDGTLQLDHVQLSGAQQYLNSQALAGTEASINGNLKFHNDAGQLSTNGIVRMENIAVHGKQLGYPVELDYNASDNLKSSLISISNTQLKIGTAPFVINGTVNAAGTPALADLKLTTQNASIAELVKLAAALGASLSPGLQPSGTLTANLTARGPLTGPAVAGILRASQLKVSGVEASALQIDLNLASPGADVVHTLTGRVSVNLSDGRLTGVDLAQRLGAIGKFTGATAVGNGATHVSSLTGDFALSNGVASTNNLKALTDAGTVAAAGTASLVDEGLNMKATAVLSKSSSQQVGGTAIGGLMTTALSNKNGEIVIPVLVSGTISSPKVEPDVRALADMRMKNLLPSFSNPGALTQGVLGKLGGQGGLFGGKSPGAAASNQQPGNTQQGIQNAIGGLGGLFGGKKKTQK